MLDRITDKFLVFGLGGALIASVGVNITQAVKLHNRSVTIAAMDKQINDPETGLISRLGTCRANNTTLQSGIDQQNANLATEAARGAQAIAEATVAVAEAQTKTAQAQERATETLERPLQGANACERAEDVDRRIMGSIK